ncbi:MAG: lysylphosphatidylglycerol synthase transmembrane domain-containing protein [Bacteroidota bacterium]
MTGIRAGKYRLFFRTALRVALALILLAILLYFVEFEQIRSAFQQARGAYITVAAGLLVFNLGLQILKWHYLLHSAGFSFSWTSILQSFFFGLTVGTLTPGQLGELGGRGFHLSSEAPERIIGLTIFDRLQMLGIMIIGGGLSLAILFNVPPLVLFLVILGSTVVLLSLILPQYTAMLLQRTPLGGLRNKWVQGFLTVLGSIKDPRTIMTTLALTLLFYATIWIQLHFLLNAFFPVSFPDSFLGYASMMLAKSALPITFADLGTRELGLVFFLSLRAVPEAAAFNSGILLFTINVLTPSLIGLLFIPRSFSLRPTS